jgi:hypothetical protein
MRLPRHDALPYALALAMLCVSYLAYASTAQRGGPSIAAQRLHAPAAALGAACGLPAGKQVKAVKAFARMMPVFRHDRCLNCHGKFNVLSVDEHSGAVNAKESKLDPTELLTLSERIAFHKPCANCHNQIEGEGMRPQKTDTVVISGWMLPPPPMRWVGKDTEQLCILVKGFEENADSFVGHVESDHGEVKFVKAAFEGLRALDSERIELYDVVAERPPGSKEQLVAQGTEWARLVGDHWKDSPECGCVLPKFKLKVEHTWVFDTPGGVPSRQASDARFEVVLEPYGEDRPNYFQGRFSLERPVDTKVPASCTAKTSVKERWEFKALLEPDSGSVKVWHTQLSDEPTGEIVCKQGGGTARMNADPGALVGLLGAGEMVIPLDSTRRKRASYEGLRESLAITVLVVPDEK